MEENAPPLEEIDQGPRGKSSNHSTVAVSTDDEFDVSALDDDIEKAAEQVVDEWSDRLKGSKVFSDGEQPEDAKLQAETLAGTMNEALPAGGYDEVVMGFDEGNPTEANDGTDDVQDGGDDDELFEEEVVEDSFSEEIIDDTEMLMDDGEIEEILSQAANIAEDKDSGDEVSAVQGELESGDQEPSAEGSVISHSSAFETRNELLSAPPELPQRQTSEDNVEDESGIEKAKKGAIALQEDAEILDDEDELLEQDLEGSVDMSVVQDVVGIHETKQHARPPVADIEQTKNRQTQASNDIESGTSVAPDIPESVPTGEQQKDWDGAVDDDDDDDGFLCCILVIACLCFVLVVLSIVLPLVFLQKRGDGPSPIPTAIPTQSPVVPPSTQVN